MRFKLEFDMGNASFEDFGSEVETASILEGLAESIREHGFGRCFERPIYDSNGNKIGTVSITA